MIELGLHAGFIVAAYAAAAVMVAGLVGWVVLDYRAQARALAELEDKGLGRSPREP
jgi:heme exporter protein D